MDDLTMLGVGSLMSAQQGKDALSAASQYQVASGYANQQVSTNSAATAANTSLGWFSVFELDNGYVLTYGTPQHMEFCETLQTVGERVSAHLVIAKCRKEVK